MSGDYFPGGQLPHEPERFLSHELMGQVEANVVYSCTDVLLRDAETGKLFLGDRQTEPQLGPWLVGGRDRYGVGIDESANLQVQKDLGMHIDKIRFEHVATYSTDFPVASPGRDSHGRHTVNSVMMVDLDPEEVSAINDKIASGEIRDEYASGAWYDPSEVAEKDSDFPDLLKQLVRDVHRHEVAKSAILDEAYHEHSIREAIAKEAQRRQIKQEESTKLCSIYGLSPEDAEEIVKTGGAESDFMIIWTAVQAHRHEGLDVFVSSMNAIMDERNKGDVHIKRALTAAGIAIPPYKSDNGPRLKGLLETATTILGVDEKMDGKLLLQAIDDNKDVVKRLLA